MKRKIGQTGFWAPGLAALTDTLRKAERRRLAPLEAELQATADPGRKRELRREMAAIKAEFLTKRKDAMYGLFAGA